MGPPMLRASAAVITPWAVPKFRPASMEPVTWVTGGEKRTAPLVTLIGPPDRDELLVLGAKTSAFAVTSAPTAVVAVRRTLFVADPNAPAYSPTASGRKPVAPYVTRLLPSNV